MFVVVVVAVVVVVIVGIHTVGHPHTLTSMVLWGVWVDRSLVVGKVYPERYTHWYRVWLVGVVGWCRWSRVSVVVGLCG